MSTLARSPLKVRDHFDKICQIILNRALVEKCWLAASIVTFKLGLAVGFIQLRLYSAIPCLSSLPTYVYSEDCITKPYYVWHFDFLLHSSDCSVLISKVIAPNNFTRYSDCQVIQLFRLTFLLIKAFTTLLTKHIVCRALRFQTKVHRIWFIKMRTIRFVSFSCWNDVSMFSNAKCIVEQRSQTFYETHIASFWSLSPTVIFGSDSCPNSHLPSESRHGQLRVIAGVA